MSGQHALLVGANHGGFEAHGHGQLGDDHAQEGQHEHDSEKGEASLVGHGVVTGSAITSGGCSTP